LLGMLGVVPDTRIFELTAYFGQLFLFRFEVKDTP